MSKTILSEGDEGVRLIIKDVKTKKLKCAETRMPVHVVYGGAHLFKADTPLKLGKIALRSLETYAPNFVEFATAMRMSGTEGLPRFPKAVLQLGKELKKNAEKVERENYPLWFAWTVYQKTIQKLKTEPVEDFRIDFEDGYGFRTDEEEDKHAIAASDELAKAFTDSSITPFSGFRIKSLAPETFGRGVDTLHLFLENFLTKTDGRLPDNFVVTMPKVSDRKEVKQLCGFLSKIEKKAGLRTGSIKIEIMIETPSAVVDKTMRKLVDAAGGRCTSAHFGAYDYTAALGITHQHIRHPACNFARQVMLLNLAPLGLRLSDSVTTEMPIPIYKGDKLTKTQINENRRAIHAGWQKHFENVTASMIDGFYQSWDLHPNQLPARYAAVYSFFLESKDTQANRLKGFIEKATQASLTGNIFDDAASAHGILNFFNRALDCGAMSAEEVKGATTLNVEEIRSGPFSS